jgi:hypothetical protein
MSRRSWAVIGRVVWPVDRRRYTEEASEATSSPTSRSGTMTMRTMVAMVPTEASPERPRSRRSHH